MTDDKEQASAAGALGPPAAGELVDAVEALIEALRGQGGAGAAGELVDAVEALIEALRGQGGAAAAGELLNAVEAAIESLRRQDGAAGAGELVDAIEALIAALRRLADGRSVVRIEPDEDRWRLNVDYRETEAEAKGLLGRLRDADKRSAKRGELTQIKFEALRWLDVCRFSSIPPPRSLATLFEELLGEPEDLTSGMLPSKKRRRFFAAVDFEVSQLVDPSGRHPSTASHSAVARAAGYKSPKTIKGLRATEYYQAMVKARRLRAPQT